MADDIRVRAQLSFAKGGNAARGDSNETSFTMTGTKYQQHVQSLTTAEEALILGEVPAAGAYYLIENISTLNAVDLKPVAGGTVTTRLKPSGVAMGTFGASVSAPFVVAVTSTADIRVLLIQA